MSFLSSVGKAFSGVIKQVAPSIIKAVAPAATKLLQGIVGDTFKAGGALLNKLAGNLPGPLGGLAQKLLGKFLPKLQQMAEGGIEGLIKKLAQSITERLAPGAGNVALPPMSNPARTDAMTAPANQPATTAPAASSSSSAATTAPATSTGSTSSASTVSTSSAGGTTNGSPITAGNKPPSQPTDWSDRAQVDKFNAEMQAYQQAMQGMQMYWQMMSNIIKSQGDTAKSLTQNLR